MDLVPVERLPLTRRQLMPVTVGTASTMSYAPGEWR